MTDVSYIVNSKVKEAIKAAGCNTSADALPAMNALAAWHISEATTRASSNGRKTVRSHDFLANASGAGAFVTISKVKEAIKAGGCNTAGDALEGLNACIASAIESAAARATANGRKTVRAHDINANGPLRQCPERGTLMRPLPYG